MRRLKSLLFTALMLTLSTVALAQTKVTGKVVDATGEPIIGATVKMKGSNHATITDMNGTFTLNDAKGSLVVSYVGYKALEVKIGQKSNLKITLSEDKSILNEVVVVGYGTQKKASLTSAISQIKGDEVFKDRGQGNTTVALQGEIPGLTVTRTSTRPGSEGAAIKIRGDISINGNSSPLILIDGVTGSLDELNSMDGNDIATISVLKDASAAIYGARSASGVILVTTKRGEKGKAKISYSGTFSHTINGIQAPITTNQQWLDMFYQAQYNDAAAANPTLTAESDIHAKVNWWVFNSFGGTTLGENPTTYVGETLFNALRNGQDLILKRGSYIDHWMPNNYMMDYLYGQASSQKHNVNISGGDDKFSYRASLGYADNKSQLKVADDGEKKYDGRLNADYQATKELKIETGVSYEKRKITTPSTDVGAGWMDPWFWTVYNQNGDAYDTFSGNRNPIGGLTQGGQNITDMVTFRATAKGTYDLSKWVDGLNISASGAYKTVTNDNTLTKNLVQYYDWVGTATGKKQSPGSLTETHQKYEDITLGAFANYNHTFNEVHNVSAMIGMTAEEENYKSIAASRSNGQLYPGSGLVDLNVWASGSNNGALGGQSSWGFVSYVTRLGYNYANKYLIEVLGRRDGSSKLSTSQRWKNFYSLSGGWVITEENFMKDLKWLSNLKIRYNYGKTGNVDGINNYERYATVGTSTTIFGISPASQTTIYLNGMTSDERTWETINSHDAGLDFAFLNNKLRGTFDYFIKTNDGMFIPVTYPSILGASAPKTNNGKFRTKGWEFSLTYDGQIGEVKYTLGGQLSDAWSKIMRLTNNENVPNPGYNTARLVGKPTTAIYVYKTDGLFQTQDEVNAYYEKYYWNAEHKGPKSGNIIPAPRESGTYRLRPGARKYVDEDGDGAITTKDLVYAGDPSPRLNFGFKLGLEWRGFDLSAFFQGVAKQKILRSGSMYAPFVTNYVLQNVKFLNNTWTADNADSKYAILSRDAAFNRWDYQNCDVSVVNNSYVRLKSLIVGYTIPQTITSKAGIEKVRVYFSGDDLWEATKVKDGYDPEYGENSNNTFPFSRLLTVGVDVTF